jgi:hypothetical protein
MLVWIHILELVCFHNLTWSIHFLNDHWFWPKKMSILCFNRAKSQGWFRVTWICSYVFLKRKVISLSLLLLVISFFNCLLFLIWYFFSLPWQGLKAGTKKQKYERISEKKVSTSIEVWLSDTTVFYFMKCMFNIFLKS